MKVSVSRQLSRVFDYPDASYLESLETLLGDLVAVQPQAAEHLDELNKVLRDKSAGEIAELYSNTFDLCPACAPYLSVHLFGEGSYKRASLMTGLAEAYSTLGVESHGELPDHLAIVLDALELLDAELRQELVSVCLVPALAKMEAELRRLNNPYLHAILTVQSWLAQTQAAREVKCA